IIHGGPFANIAHGCNSIIATKTALSLADFAVTEAGFGADLGAEKFYDIKCRQAGLKPNMTVVVATIRALKYHGGQDLKKIDEENIESLKKGFENLRIHLENLKKFSKNIVVAINKFDQDTNKELETLKNLVENLSLKAFECDVYHKGSEGCLEICNYIIEKSKDENDFKVLYDEKLPIEEKIEIIAKEIYRASGVKYSKKALNEIKRINNLNSDKLPICIAKTQYSLSDDPTNLNPDSEYEITINDIRLNQGAGFIVALTQNILTMPGLPKRPAAYDIDIDDDGNIMGLF
ncbi:formate--tetrahydrofolate ligase, partial [Anaerococcus obesiensis]